MHEIPLAFTPSEHSYVVKEVKGGWGLRRRLAELGITPGTRIQVIKSSGGGPVLVSVKGSRIALGWGVAMRIIVVENDGREEKPNRS